MEMRRHNYLGSYVEHPIKQTDAVEKKGANDEEHKDGYRVGPPESPFYLPMLPFNA